MEEIHCPFCGYHSESEYRILYHMEDKHPDGESPFVATDVPSPDIKNMDAFKECEDELDFVPCPRDGCGETILLTELEEHIDMHSAEINTGYSYHESKRLERSASNSNLEFDPCIPQALRNLGGSSSADVPFDRNASSKEKWKEILSIPNKKPPSSGETLKTRKHHRRLGRAELGPYAHEKQMPDWLKRLLESDGEPRPVKGFACRGKLSRVVENHTPGIVPVVEYLLQQNSSTVHAYLCNPHILHISKLPDEGGFCGYRNIQMLTSYINGTASQGCHHFNGKTPTIFQIQDLIEHAWDIGIHAQGRLETGGIRGTRKYIGTPEAQAMLLSLDITCDAQGLKSKGSTTADGKYSEIISADEALFHYVEEYFSSADCTDPEIKIQNTGLPPLYFQHPGHSLTIIGLEKTRDGNRNLLVFDPMFRDSADVIKLVEHPGSVNKPGDLLRAYRRTAKYLRKYKEFEVLRLTPPNNHSQAPELFSSKMENQY